MNTGRSTPGLAAKQRPSHPKFGGVSNGGVFAEALGQQSRQPTLISRSSTPGTSPALGPIRATLTSPLKESVPVNDLVQLARQSFSQKDFTAALQFLTRALTIAPKDINLLDSRAASCEKLNRLDDALADAKAMIKNHPQNPKGYLRAGKILRLQQSIKSSAKVYIAGAERADKESKEYDILARIASDIRIKLDEIAKKEARVLDPVEILPLELIVIVFDNLSFAERVRCLTISKKWMTHLGSVRHFWYSIDLARRIPSQLRIPNHSLYMPPSPDYEANNKITNRTVVNLVKYASPKVLRLGCAQQITGALFTQMTKAKRTGALENLSLRMNSKVYGQELSLLWSTTPKLQFLDLHGCSGVTDTVVASVLERCPLLEELDISECRLTEACFMEGKATPNLKKLVFGREEMQFAKEGVDAMVARFPSLNTLDIRTMRPRGIEALESIYQLKHLKHLYTNSVETSGDITTNYVLERWVRGISDLESLQLSSCKGVSDMTILLIAGYLVEGEGEGEPTRRGWSHSLRMLDLSLSPYMTCQGLSSLSNYPMLHLHTLILNKCGRVSEAGLRSAVTSSGGELCRLECVGYSTVSDKLLFDIKTYCPKIEIIDLASSGQVTGIGLMALVNERGRGIEKICVDDCPALSADAVDRARSVLGAGRVQYRFHRTHR
ncbi:hypothetical protein BGX34_001827 [Mortierella sp. NVP85]|nr:hypothetical protein BGX34_001827 [Mortierella sp. NVP85]